MVEVHKILSVLDAHFEVIARKRRWKGNLIYVGYQSLECFNEFFGA